MAEIDEARRAALLEQGYTLFPGVLSTEELERLRAVSARLLEERAAEQAWFKTQGSMIPATADASFAELIAHERALGALAALGMDAPAYTNGYVISKPGGSPRLFWHYDWFAWDDPSAFAEAPPQVFAMYYLSDTRRENGCLRVIPGSHRRHDELHDLLKEPHGADLMLMTDPDDVAFSDRPNEADVPVEAGDLIVGDARLLHAAHANGTGARRTLITLWYQPDPQSLPESVRAHLVEKTQGVPDDWPEAARAKVERLHPTYDGEAAPHPRVLYRRQEAHA